MSRHIMTLRCPCCGAPFETSGCVHGPRCDCKLSFGADDCPLCHKCPVHCACQKNAEVETEIAIIRAETEPLKIDMETHANISIALRQIQKLTRVKPPR